METLAQDSHAAQEVREGRSFNPDDFIVISVQEISANPTCIPAPEFATYRRREAAYEFRNAESEQDFD
jgi:hypothetical protein